MKKLIAIILSITIICAFIACESTNQKQSDVEKYSYLTFEIDDENGEKYVYSVPAVKYSRSTPTKTEYFSIPRSSQYSGSAALPYRDGYAFLGWATTEGKTTPNYTFVSTKYTPTSGSSSLNVMGTLPDSDEEETIPLGTTLYAVWQELDENGSVLIPV